LLLSQELLPFYAQTFTLVSVLNRREMLPRSKYKTNR
jgi:hypothetical protein